MDLPDRVQWQARRLVRERPIVTVPAMPAPSSAEAPTDFVETLRKLLRQRYLVLACTAGAAVLTIALVSQLPARYIAEARVLVGVPAPRALNIASIINDVSPDAEVVQSEIFAAQSRDLAGVVIDRLHLGDNPEFNPTLPQQTSLVHRIA